MLNPYAHSVDKMQSYWLRKHVVTYSCHCYVTLTQNCLTPFSMDYCSFCGGYLIAWLVQIFAVIKRIHFRSTEFSLFMATQQRSRTTIEKFYQKQVHPRVIDSPNLPRDTRVKVTLVSRPLRTWCVHEQNMCSFLNITLHRSRFLLFVKHLAMRVLTRKYRIRQQHTDW
jgi:hypothetical protein